MDLPATSMIARLGSPEMIVTGQRASAWRPLADGSYLRAFTQLRGLFGEDGTPLYNYASYLGVADLAAAAVCADRRIEGCDIIEHALSRLDGSTSTRLEQLSARALGILAEPSNSEAHFVRLASDGLTDREIGDRLFLSPRTVSSHLYRSCPGLGAASRHQLRDVIARASTPPAAREGGGSRNL